MNGKNSGVQIEDFLNPKSMPTPAAAGAMVALIAGALFKGFGLSVAFGSMVLSFLVGAIVFQSRQFRSERMSWFAKLSLYAINSLIIFAMATGTTSVMAAEVMVQQRPLFNDWTKQPLEIPTSFNTKAGEFVLSADVKRKDYGGFRGLLMDSGIITKEYSVNLKILPSDDSPGQEIESVTLNLPDGLFDQSQIQLSPEEIKNGVNLQIWRGFPVEAEVTTKSGETYNLFKSLNTD